MLSPTLGPDADARLAAARSALAELRDALVRFGATPDDHDRLIQSIAQLDDVFLLVVVGEFNSGKSAFINALVGTPAVREGVTPTTATLQLLEFGESAGEHRRADGTLVVSAPAPVLRHLHIVDTPGTNAILREHERLTTEFVPRADLVLFVTSAERPFTETERAFMDVIRRWGKKIVLVVNKIDILERPQEVEDVVA
ncbi:MAG: dynamin family protein, partial [Vicinamibacterales bacterium]